jgi:solute carrier family 25 (mitochondrial S-adenosylmethionine transporter), member 26
LALFPLDTLKTRLQSPKGFWNSGGLRGIYSGLPSTLVGSAPTAALFFVVYDTSKNRLIGKGGLNASLSQIIAANFGEIVYFFYTE